MIKRNRKLEKERLLTYSRINIEEDFCYPEFPIIDNGILFISLRFSMEPFISAMEAASTPSEIRSINLFDKSTNWIYQFSQTHAKPVISENTLIACTDNYVIALNKKDGSLLWQYNAKLWNPNVSIIDNTVFITEHNRIILLDIETGKKIKSKKYRVKWLCESVTEHHNRLFVSTSNSKIIEIDKNTLEITNEYRFNGMWSIALSPLFSGNRMYSSSYTSYAMCFDLITNEEVWKVKKKAGSEPKHAFIPENDLFCIIESFGTSVVHRNGNPIFESAIKVTACSLETGKRKWSQNYHLYCLKDLNENNMIGLGRDEQGNYQVYIIKKDTGKIEEQLLLTDYRFDDRYQYRLWDGADIILKENIIVIAYSPNEVFLIDRKSWTV